MQSGMQPGGPENAAPASRSPFSTRATLVYAALWLTLTLYGWRGVIVEGHAYQLFWPLDAAERVIDRDLLLADALAERPAWERRLWAWLEATPEELREGAVAVQREALAVAAERGEPTRGAATARLAVLLAETQPLEEALAAAAESDDPRALGAVLLAAYGAGGRGAAESLPDTPARELSGWAGERLRLRLARRGGDDAAADALARALEASGREVLRKSRLLAGARIALVAGGLALLAAWAARGRLPTAPAERRGPPPWTLATGIAVLVRGDFWNRLYFVALSELPASWAQRPPVEVLYYSGTLFASLPLLFLVWRHLLPAEPTRDPLGLRPRAPAPLALAGFALAVTAVDLVLTDVVGWTSGFLGRGWDWAEGFSETLVWSPGFQASLATLDLVVWAPLFEELAFRGVLYLSLRRRLGTLPAAAASALVFACLHFYSWAGLAATLVSGLVWALAFERVRSLWPGVLAHALYNALYVAGVLLLYR